MKKILLFPYLLLGAAFFLNGTFANLQAQTDVTSTYLKNPGFDSVPISFTVAGGATVNSSAVRVGTTGWMYEVSDWTNAAVCGNNAVQMASGEYGGVANSAGFNGVTPPATDKNGASAGACLHMSAGWGDDAILTQTVTLPEGRYALKLDAYNSHTNTACAVNFCGFVPTSGEAVYSTLKTFPNAVWTSDSIYFNLVQETEGKISIGFTTSNGSSGNGAKLFIDNVQLYYYGIVIDKAPLQALVDSATVIYNAGVGNGLADLNTVIIAAKSVITNDGATALEVANAEKAMKEAIAAYYWANASKTNPLNITSTILNPSFELGSGGSLTGVNGGGNLNVPKNWNLNTNVSWMDSNPNSSGPQDGTACWNIWAGTVNSLDLYQEITLDKGCYVVSAAMRTQKAEEISNQRVYATVQNITFYSDTLTFNAGAASWNTVDAWINLTDTFYVGTDDAVVRIGAGSTGGASSLGWFQIDNFQLQYCGSDITPLVQQAQLALAARVLELQSTDFSNVGENVFQVPVSAKTTFEAAITTAQNFTGSTVDDYVNALTTLNTAYDTFLAAELKAPEVTQAYQLTLTNNNAWTYDGKAVTWSNDRADMGYYNLRYADILVPVDTTQVFYFVALPETNCYNVKFIGADILDHYICTGMPYAGNNNQIRTTLTAADAVSLKIEYAGSGYYKLKNMAANVYIGSQDAGVFTVNSHNNFQFTAVTLPTSVSETLAGKLCMTVSNKTLRVSGTEHYTVYTLQGVKVAQKYGNESITLSEGIYLVQANGQCAKVLIY